MPKVNKEKTVTNEELKNLLLQVLEELSNNRANWQKLEQKLSPTKPEWELPSEGDGYVPF